MKRIRQFVGTSVVLMTCGLLGGVGCADVEEEEDVESTESSIVRPLYLNTGCPSGSACLYQHANYRGWALEVRGGGCQPLTGIYDNYASSVRNNTRYSITLYEGPNCTGSQRAVDSGKFVGDLSFGNGGTYGMNDKISSVSISAPATRVPGTSMPGTSMPGTSNPAPSTSSPSPAGTTVDGKPCEVRQYPGSVPRLHCANAAVDMQRTPKDPTKVNRLKTTYSWFDCWGVGPQHSGGNTTWYRTIGDDNNVQGWVPAARLHTSHQFDTDPVKYGLWNCTSEY